MAWDNFQAQNSSVRRLFVEEGNISVLLIPSTPTRVRFLTEDVATAEAAAAAQMTKGQKGKKVGKEELQEYLYTTYAKDHWVMPMSVWEHTIKDGARVSFQVCAGIGQCKYCEVNGEAKEKGVAENKLLPYPVRRRFVVPIWSYEHKRLFYLKQAEEFIQDVKTYMDKNGVDVEFDIYRTGSGFGTKYKAIFVGKCEEVKWPIDRSKVIAPSAIKWADHSQLPPAPGEGEAEEEPAATEQEAESGAPASTPASSQQAGEDPASFVLSFGSHKGKTIGQLHEQKLDSYIKFLASSASGVVQEKAQAFIELNS